MHALLVTLIFVMLTYKKDESNVYHVMRLGQRKNLSPIDGNQTHDAPDTREGCLPFNQKKKQKEYGRSLAVNITFRASACESIWMFFQANEVAPVKLLHVCKVIFRK